MPLSPGSRIGPYEIEASVGAGGMGEVYRARDTRLERVVALKVLASTASRKPAASTHWRWNSSTARISPPG